MNEYQQKAIKNSVTNIDELVEWIIPRLTFQVTNRGADSIDVGGFDQSKPTDTLDYILRNKNSLTPIMLAKNMNVFKVLNSRKELKRYLSENIIFDDSAKRRS